MKNGSLVVEYSLTPTRRGRKPSNQPVLVNTGKMPRITRLMALAIKFEGLIRDGVVSDYADLARLGVVTRARMTQIMNLLNLAPDIQEEILFLPKTLPWFKSRIPCEAEFGWAFDSKAEWRISKTVSYANRTPPRMPLFQKVRLAERYDIAIMSCKGMGTTAGRTLIDDLSGKVKILVVRDFDKAGFSIFGTLKWDTRRHKHVIRPMVIDIGLRLEDVQKWNLPAEDVINDSDPTDNLVKNGATAEEVAFIRGTPIAGSGRKQKYKGRRVELNACTSDQFVQWLEGKLAAHGVGKVIPEESTLERAYRRAAGIKRCQATLDTAFAKIEAYAAGIAVPKDLAERVRLQLAQAPEQSWDDVIVGLVPPVTLDE